MKRLYQVEAMLTLCVMAESEAEAREVACENMDSELSSLDETDLDATPLEYIPSEWSGYHPYGLDDYDTRTVEEIFEAEKEEKARDIERLEYEKKQIKLF